MPCKTNIQLLQLLAEARQALDEMRHMLTPAEVNTRHYTTAQVCSAYKLTPYRLRKLYNKGILKPLRTAAGYLWSKTELETHLKK